MAYWTRYERGHLLYPISPSDYKVQTQSFRAQVYKFEEYIHIQVDHPLEILSICFQCVQCIAMCSLYWDVIMFW